MKSKCLVFISCSAAVGLIASPVLSAPQKNSIGTARSGVQRTAPRTTRVMPAPKRGAGSSYQYAGTRQYVGMRQYAATPQYRSTQRYTSRSYAGNSYYGGSRYSYSYGNPGYYGGGLYPYYGYYSGWPSGYYGYGYYPYSYYSGYPSTYSYYQPGYASDGGTVAAVQRRLGELGYYHGVVDGIMGPQTRWAIAAYESRHGIFVDGVITTRLLDRMGLT